MLDGISLDTIEELKILIESKEKDHKRNEKEAQQKLLKCYSKSVVEICYEGTNFYNNGTHKYEDKIHMLNVAVFVKYLNKTYLITTANSIDRLDALSVKLLSTGKRFDASIIHSDPECSLTLLDVADKAFWNQLVPLELGSMATRGQDINIYELNYNFTITQGKVLRHFVQSCIGSDLDFLQAQIETKKIAQTGGPIIKADKVLGIIFQGENDMKISYMLPAIIIKYYLQAVAATAPYQGIKPFLNSDEYKQTLREYTNTTFPSSTLNSEPTSDIGRAPITNSYSQFQLPNDNTAPEKVMLTPEYENMKPN